MVAAFEAALYAQFHMRMLQKKNPIEMKWVFRFPGQLHSSGVFDKGIFSLGISVSICTDWKALPFPFVALWS